MIKPIPDDEFNLTETEVIPEPIKKQELPQPKPELVDISKGITFERDYNQTKRNTEQLAEDINRSYTLIGKLKSKQDELIKQVNTNTDDIKTIKQQIEEINNQIEEIQEKITELEDNIALLAKPPTQEIEAQDSINSIAAQDEVKIDVEFDANNSDGFMNLTISSLVTVGAYIDGLECEIRVNNSVRYNLQINTTSPNFDVSPEAGLIELYLKNTTDQVINNVNYKAFLNVRGA